MFCILLSGNTKVRIMKMSFNTVIEYVKNLLPGYAPVAVSDNPQLDAQVLAKLASNYTYVEASNGHRYWYYFVPVQDLKFAQCILRDNGINARRHNSRYYYSLYPVLRVRSKYLRANPAAAKFVKSIMSTDPRTFDEAQVIERMQQLRQKVR